MIKLKDLLNEEKPGLWANIRAKQARGEKPAHGNSDAHKDAVKAGKEINKEGTLTEKKYYVTYNLGRGRGKDLEKEFDQKSFKTTDKPKVFNSYSDAKKYAEKMEKMFRNSIGGGTAYWVSDEKMNPIKESELKGYLAADVVDDIVKSIGSKFVSGQIKNAPNKNYIYLKLTDIKFGSGVVKILKSQFGIDAKIDKTFGNIPSVSFASKKVVSEAAGTLTIEKRKDGKYYWQYKFKSGKKEDWPEGFNTKADAQKDFMYRSKYIKEAKAPYEVYHKSYTSAIEAAREYAEKKGFEIDNDDSFTKIGMGPRKPSEGKTNKFSIQLSKDGKLQRKQLHIQVYGMKNSYELNAYIG
jgi:hypothetical protein